jgi:endonuclease YncB( thermonuclease family)
MLLRDRNHAVWLWIGKRHHRIELISAAVFEQNVTVHSTRTDRYGRTIGTLLLNGKSINRMMVAQGMAWAYKQYLSDR